MCNTHTHTQVVCNFLVKDTWSWTNPPELLTLFVPRTREPPSPCPLYICCVLILLKSITILDSSVILSGCTHPKTHTRRDSSVGIRLGPSMLRTSVRTFMSSSRQVWSFCSVRFWGSPVVTFGSEVLSLSDRFYVVCRKDRKEYAPTRRSFFRIGGPTLIRDTSLLTFVQVPWPSSVNLLVVFYSSLCTYPSSDVSGIHGATL